MIVLGGVAQLIEIANHRRRRIEVELSAGHVADPEPVRDASRDEDERSRWAAELAAIQEDLAAVGVTADDLRAGRYGPSFVALMRRQAVRAREYYDRATDAFNASKVGVSYQMPFPDADKLHLVQNWHFGGVPNAPTDDFAIAVSAAGTAASATAMPSRSSSVRNRAKARLRRFRAASCEIASFAAASFMVKPSK